MVLTQELEQHRVRRVGVARADADRAEQEAILRIPAHEGADTAPEEEQRVVVLLIFESNEGSTELQCRRAETREEPLVVLEQRSRVQPANADVAGDAVRPADSVCADDLPLLRIPCEQVQVRAVELVEVDALPGAFADRTKRNLPKPPDLAQRPRNRVGRRAVDAKGAGLDQARVI